MQLETAISREALGQAAYLAACRKPKHDPDGHWDVLDPDVQSHWVDVADAVLMTVGLGTLAEDVIAERTAVDAGTVELEGKRYMRDAKGSLAPLNLIKAQHLLEDETVRKVMRFALSLSAQVGRFKGHCFEDLNALQSLFEQQYGARSGGAKGNVTFRTFDDTMRVEVKIADLIEFGAEILAAKKLVDECLVEWGAESHDALRALVNRVFSVEKEGQINRADVFSLLRMEIEDARWNRAMDAIRDSIRITGSKAYLRFRTRPDTSSAWSTVTIDLAAA